MGPNPNSTAQTQPQIVHFLSGWQQRDVEEGKHEPSPCQYIAVPSDSAPSGRLVFFSPIGPRDSIATGVKECLGTKQEYLDAFLS